jgi:oxygen-independent coproporphyrinogen III oxidase
VGAKSEIRNPKSEISGSAFQMTSTLDASRLTPELLARYDRPGPRYTSYPTAPHFSTGFDEEAYAERLRAAAERRGEPLSMYVHLPFCEARCTFCGCNVVISPRRGPEERYLEAVEAELDLLRTSLGERPLNQLHWGGGTPTYLTPAQCERLFAAITSRFPLAGDAEVALEIDPCVTTMEHLATLRRLGFNRVSMGLQDTDPAVQEAVRRIQPLELTREHVDEARRLGFASVNIDLIYGLPLQTEPGFRATVRTVIDELAPDRVACFSYAHVPWIKPHQKALETASMPAGWEKFQLFLGAAEEFTAAGYRFVGFDHFARPDDELARALDEDRVHRNFMGYTVMPAADQVGIGATAIGDVAGAYVANEKNLARYQRRVEGGRLPVERGLLRSPEDELRRAVIHRIICTLALDYSWVEQTFGVDPRLHFADALTALEPMAADGLVALGDRGLSATEAGRFFLRNICMPFDAYLADADTRPLFSRTV